MRAFLMVGLFGTSVLAGCGSDGNEGPGTGNGGTPGTGSTPATGGAPGTGGSNPGTGGSNPGTGGAGGSSMGTGGDTVGPGGNQYPGGETVNACYGNCPKGECDDEGFWSDTPCASVYPAPIDKSSAYCGAGDGAYCLDVGGSFGETFGVRCVGGKATVHFCSFTCGGSGLSDFECR